jgi:hypothetical protein
LGTVNSLDGPLTRDDDGNNFVQLNRARPNQKLSLQIDLSTSLLGPKYMCLEVVLYAVSPHAHDQIHFHVQPQTDEQSDKESLNCCNSVRSRCQPIAVRHQLTFDGWTRHHVQLTSSMFNHNLHISANISALYISHTKAVSAVCPQTDVCSFEIGAECWEWFEPGFTSKAIERIEAIEVSVSESLPDKDTSTNSPFGHYLRLLPTPIDQSVRLFELPLPSSYKPLWLDMQVYWPTEHAVELSVWYETKDKSGLLADRHLIWCTEQLHPDDHWQRIVWPIAVQRSADARIVMYVRDTKEHGALQVALDDVHIRAMDTYRPASCSFEANMCAFSNGRTANVNFLIGSGRLYAIERSSKQRLMRDLNSNNRYLYLDLTWLPVSKTAVSAVLRSELLAPVHQVSCVRVTYSYFGLANQGQTAQLFLVSGSLRRLLTEFKISNELVWTDLSTSLTEIRSFVLEIDFSMPAVEWDVPFFAIKSIQFETKECDSDSESKQDEQSMLDFQKWKSMVDCRFDTSVCEWYCGSVWEPIQDVIEARKRFLPLVDPDGSESAI